MNRILQAMLAASNMRFLGDFSLAFSFPILWYRLRHIGGGGISCDTQVLHLLTFLLRYIQPGGFNVSWYNTILKIWYITASAATIVLVRLAYLEGIKFGRIRGSSRQPSPVIVMLLLASLPPLASTIYTFYSFTHLLSVHDWVIIICNTSWTVSQLLSIGAMVPQLVIMYKCAGPKYSKPTRVPCLGGVDVTLWVYVGSIAAFRTLYIPYWADRQRNDPFLRFFPHDRSQMICGCGQLAVILSFVLASLIKIGLSRWREANTPATSAKNRAYMRLDNSVIRVSGAPVKNITMWSDHGSSISDEDSFDILPR